ncbi:MAG: hypothetical protein R2789_16775 [Microthrixaceae bacterium]
MHKLLQDTDVALHVRAEHSEGPRWDALTPALVGRHHGSAVALLRLPNRTVTALGRPQASPAVSCWMSMENLS